MGASRTRDSFQQQAEILTSVLGHTIRYENIPPNEHKQRLLSFGQPETYADAELELDAELRAGSLNIVSEDVQSLIGRPARSFETFVKDHVERFTSENIS